MGNIFKNIFKKKPNEQPKKDWFKQFPDIRIVPAFTLQATEEYPETTYYEFEDPNNLSSGRGFAALNYYNELSMKCTREFLLAHTEAIDKIVRNPKLIDIVQIAKLNLQLKERLDLVIDSMTPYKVSSVIYFDETENPYDFDYDYALKKIERWKKLSVSTFFLQTPAKNLIPSTLWSEETLENYMKIAKEMDKIHYKDISDVIFRVLSEKEKMSDVWKRLELEKNLI